MSLSRVGAVAMAVVACSIGCDAARGDGLPVIADSAGPSGVATPDGRYRYVTVDAGRGTVLERVARAGGTVKRSTFLRGTFTVPAVALDGTPAGLSHDGSTLVLVRPRSRFPRARTTLAIVDASALRTRLVRTLRGDFSFDAVSPDGRTAYLVQYLDPRDPTKYLVRALDARSGRLLRKPVVDPHEDPGEMAGTPLTRTVSAGGRWHYTLYNRRGAEFFVHALDSRDRRAKCIDLPALPNPGDMYAFRLRSGPGGLSIRGRRGPVARIDTASWRVTRPAAVAAEARGGSGSIGAAGWVVAIGAVGLAAAMFRRRHRRRARRSVAFSS